MKRLFRLFILLVVLIPQSIFAQTTSDTDILSEEAKEYLSMIKTLEGSSPQEYGVTENNYNVNLCVCYAHVALEYYDLALFDKALEYAEKSAAYGIKADNKGNYFFVCKLISSVSSMSAKYEIGFKYLSDALVLADSLGDKENKFQLLLEYYYLAKKVSNHQLMHDITKQIGEFDIDELSADSRLDLLTHEISHALSTGDPETALIYIEEYRRKLEILPKESQKEGLILCLQYESDCYALLKNYEEAARCREMTLPADHNPEDYAGTYILAMAYYIESGNVEKINEYIDKLSQLSDSRKLSVAQRGELHYQLCTAFLELERYEEAYEQILLSIESGIQSDWFLIQKGIVLHKLGRNEESRKVLIEYAEYCREKYGPDSIKYADALRFLANIEAFCGNTHEGADLLMKSLTLVENFFKAELPYVSHDLIESFWNDVSKGILEMAAYAVGAEMFQCNLTTEAYEGLVLSKALLLTHEKTFAEYVAHSGDPGLKELYQRTLDLRNRKEDLKKSYMQNKEEIMSLQRELSALESRLAQQGSAWTEHTDYFDVSFEQLKKSLKDNEVVVDMVDHSSKEFGRKYLAFVYRRNWEHPLIVPICTQKDLDSYAIRSARPDQIYSRKVSAELMDLLWKPLEEYVDPGEKVYIIPSGDMHMISYDSFQLSDGSLLGSKYDFIRLTSAREILHGISSDIRISSAALYGGLQYDLTADERVEESRRYGDVSRAALQRRARGNTSYTDLPMSREEVLIVESMLKKAGVEDVRCYLDKQGTEESFMSLGVPSPHIIHLATHGFYYTPEDAVSVQGLSGYKNAMMLSGLVLAGGNAEWKGEDVPENTLGGILTAEDISLCDLSNTELVVLTACDTGKGKITPEGVYGLQRAFKKAGAKSIIMSLWKTDDTAAKEFMQLFYESLTTNNWDRHAAFQYAKDKMRNKYRQPYYWAGFIMLD